MKVFILILLISFLTVSCGGSEVVKAKIFERKEVNDKTIMIRYQYAVNDQVYSDSLTMNNKVINSDSISIKIDPSNPSKGIPQFEN